MPTRIKICMCGAKHGEQHDALCPYPYYGADIVLESEWMDAWRIKKINAESTQPIDVNAVRRSIGKLQA